MKNIWMKRTLNGCLVVGSALSFVVCSSNSWAAGVTAEGSLAEELQSSVESENVMVGQIDSINQDSITIDDKGHRLIKNTHYRTKGGGVTQKSHFSVGDRVQYIASNDGSELVLVELRLKEQAPDKVKSTKRDSGGAIQLKGGVWTN